MGGGVSEARLQHATRLLRGLALMALAAGLAALLFPQLRQAIGIDRSDDARLAAARQLFEQALAGRAPVQLRSQGSDLGLAVSPAPREWQGVMLAEPEGDCRARGVYLVRQSEDLVPLAISAPHRGADRHTGTLAAALFIESRAAAAAWNSAPRRPLAKCPHAIDLARQPHHPFTAFALAFAHQHPGGLLVQLHGFEPRGRGGAAARGAAMILSNGSRRPDARLLGLADCLSLALVPQRVLVFPNETGELGGTENAQGTALRDAGFTGFVHLEMSAGLRTRLVQDQVLRQRMCACLIEAAQ